MKILTEKTQTTKDYDKNTISNTYAAYLGMYVLDQQKIQSLTDICD